MIGSAQPAPRREEEVSDFAASVVRGLSKERKSIPCRFLYDARGSELFEEITALPEYYPTRCEFEILTDRAEEISSGRDSVAALVEFGSGSCRKTEILIERLRALSLYIPIDISSDALRQAKTRLESRFPQLRVSPVVADFTRPAFFSEEISRAIKLGFFPGSTIGNFTPAQAAALLTMMRRSLSPQGALIIGVDLKKDSKLLTRAYDDAQGVTAAFNLNLLARINRELGGSFDLRGFRHEAVYDGAKGCIEMRLVSLKDQTAMAAGRRFHFVEGERIHTESSYKYTIPEFRRVAGLAGWKAGRVWKDMAGCFSLHELVA
jgi:dimethylhistidine N-methyltransferase